MPPPAPPHRIGLIVSSGVFGFLAGAVGGLVATVFLTPDVPAVVPELFRRAASVRGAPSLAVVSGATVDIFAVSADDTLPALVPFSNRVGRGVVITDDGWVVTVRAAVRTVRDEQSGQRIPVVVGRNRQVLPVDRVAYDPISDLVFLHAQDVRATVLPLRARNALTVGQALVVPTTDGGLASTALQSRTAPLSPGPLHTGDVWATALTFTPAIAAPPGSPLVDASGALTGILLTDDRALPADAITTAMRQLFARGAVERNVLGFTYRDLAEFARAERNGEGIVIERPAGARAGGRVFPPGSPLVGKLAVGDRILAVGDEPLTTLRHLSELLQEYPIGAMVSFGVLRRGERSTVEVPLTTVRGEVLLVAAPRAMLPANAPSSP